MKLHLGCGNDYKEGYVNCDVTDRVRVDKIVDLEKPLTMFKDNSVSEIIIYHTLEHINNFMILMEELHRILKKDGILDIQVPYYSSKDAHQDPTHVRFFTLKTFDYFTKQSGFNYYSNARFEVVEKRLRYFIKREIKSISFLMNLNQRFYEKFFANIFPANDLVVKLRCVK